MNQRIHFAVLMLKSSFNVLGAITKCQKCSESETLHEIWEVFRYAKDETAQLKTYWQGATQFFSNKCILKSFKFLANNLDTVNILLGHIEYR